MKKKKIINKYGYTGERGDWIYLDASGTAGGGGYCKGAIYIVGCVGKVDLSLMAKPDCRAARTGVWGRDEVREKAGV